jgi:hypothetical protein
MKSVEFLLLCLLRCKDFSCVSLAAWSLNSVTTNLSFFTPFIGREITLSLAPGCLTLAKPFLTFFSVFTLSEMLSPLGVWGCMEVLGKMTD